MRRVIIESPYKGGVEENIRYARECLMDSLARGEAPIASHLLYTQVLDDTKPADCKLGIEAGLAWHSVADAVIFYIDMGWSEGMNAALKLVSEVRMPAIETRILGGHGLPWKPKTNPES